MIRYAISAALVAFAIPAAAQSGEDPYAACAATADSAARLACFDETHARVAIVRASEGESAAERARRAEQRRVDEFGLAAAQREERRDAERAADPVAAADVPEGNGLEITATVTEAFVDGLRRSVLLLDNGQLWREGGDSRMFFVPRAGWQARITQHWSGAYEMRFEGQRGYLRVTRVR